MKDCKVNILGTEYSILFVDQYPEHLKDYEKTANGLSNSFDKQIHIKNCNDIDCTNEGRKRLIKNLLRHEIIHAFLEESGLSDNSNRNAGAWAVNEEMVDWFAIQSPKIYKVFAELDIL